MPEDEEKKPDEKLKEKLSSLFSSQDPQKKQGGLPPKAHFSIWYFLIAFLLLTLLQQYYLSPKVETIPYSKFKQYLSERQISKVIIGPENISGTLKGKEGKPEQEFMTVRVDDPNLVKELDEQ